MSSARRPKSARGFSALEILIVLAIAGLVAYVSVPWFEGVRRQTQLSTVTRKLVGHLAAARVYGSTGRQIDDNIRATRAFLRIDSDTEYSIWAARGADELEIERINLLERYAAESMRIVEPSAGTEIEFRNDGSATSNEIVVADATMGTHRTIIVSAVGMVRVR